MLILLELSLGRAGLEGQAEGRGDALPEPRDRGLLDAPQAGSVRTASRLRSRRNTLPMSSSLDPRFAEQAIE